MAALLFHQQILIGSNPLFTTQKMTLGINKLSGRIKHCIITKKQSITLNLSYKNSKIIKALILNGFIKTQKKLVNNILNKKVLIFIKRDKANTAAVSGITDISKIERQRVFSKNTMKKQRSNLSNYIFKPIVNKFKSNNAIFTIG
jgi:ribosomal protein S8